MQVSEPNHRIFPFSKAKRIKRRSRAKDISQALQSKRGRSFKRGEGVSKRGAQVSINIVRMTLRSGGVGMNAWIIQSSSERSCQARGFNSHRAGGRYRANYGSEGRLSRVIGLWFTV
jgi:hypothetical protein